MNTPLMLMLLAALSGPVESAATAPARAKINATCAPWDGPAFELTIPSNDTTSASTVTVAIWQAAGIERPTVFRFPDHTQHVGAAWLLTHAGKREELTGSISLTSVLVGQPVIGAIRFTGANGLKVVRAFRAEWGTRREICGA
jgi:hypothetical protein